MSIYISCLSETHEVLGLDPCTSPSHVDDMKRKLLLLYVPGNAPFGTEMSLLLERASDELKKPSPQTMDDVDLSQFYMAHVILGMDPNANGDKVIARYESLVNAYDNKSCGKDMQLLLGIAKDTTLDKIKAAAAASPSSQDCTRSHTAAAAKKKQKRQYAPSALMCTFVSATIHDHGGWKCSTKELLEKFNVFASDAGESVEYKTLAQFTRRVRALEGIRCYRFNNVRFCETVEVEKIKECIKTTLDAATTLRQESDDAELEMSDGQGESED